MKTPLNELFVGFILFSCTPISIGPRSTIIRFCWARANKTNVKTTTRKQKRKKEEKEEACFREKKNLFLQYTSLLIIKRRVCRRSVGHRAFVYSSVSRGGIIWCDEYTQVVQCSSIPIPQSVVIPLYGTHQPVSHRPNDQNEINKRIERIYAGAITWKINVLVRFPQPTFCVCIRSRRRPQQRCWDEHWRTPSKL